MLKFIYLFLIFFLINKNQVGGKGCCFNLCDIVTNPHLFPLETVHKHRCASQSEQCSEGGDGGNGHVRIVF